MKAHLLYRDADLDLERELPPQSDALVRDLELEIVLAAMAGGDEFLREISRRVLLLGLDDPEAIAYRQGVLDDCLRRPDAARAIYDLTVEAVEAPRRLRLGLFMSRDSPEMLLHRSVPLLEALLAILKQLRRLAEEHAESFRSEGLTRLCATLVDELDDGYLATLERHLEILGFRRGVLLSAELGRGNKGVRYVVRKERERSWTERIADTVADRTPAFTFTIPDRDENGHRALTELRNRGLNAVSNALAQSTDHVLSFFAMLRAELAFYVACANLHARLAARGEPTSFPEAVDGEVAFGARGLYDVALALSVDGRVVGNDVDADGKRLVMVTGANQGGKSTFLRSVGLAQLMLRAGMFVGAEALRADVRDGVFTHFKREEDEAMESGKLDEELARMSEIAARVSGRSLLLCNESFASTNEREGSEIARQIVRALTEAGAKVFYVTHLYDLAHGLYAERGDGALFLRAERRDDGSRTFRLREGEPLPTSHGADSYRRVFGEPPADAVGARAERG